MDAGDGGLRPPGWRLDEDKTAENEVVSGDDAEPGPGLVD